MRSESLSWAVRGAGLTVGVVLVLALLGLLVAAREVVLLVFLAIILGAALEPVVSLIRGRTGMRRGPAVLLVYAVFLAIVIAIAVFIVPAALVQLGNALRGVPAFLEQIRTWTQANLHPDALAQGVSNLIDAVEAPFQPGPPPDPKSVLDASIVAGAAAGALITLLALVYFWLTARSRLQRYALAFVPRERRQGVREAWNDVETRLGLWARGQLTLMGTIGLGTGVAYTLIGLPAALLLGLIAALTEAIPIVGPFLGAIPAILIATTISTQTVIITIVVYVALHAIEGNVLVPIIMRNSVGLPPFLVLVSLLAGGAAAGILGAIVAIPIAAALTVILERLQARRHPVPVDPAALKSEEEVPEEAKGTAPDSPARTRRRRASESG